jgi:hypothetical protein
MEWEGWLIGNGQAEMAKANGSREWNPPCQLQGPPTAAATPAQSGVGVRGRYGTNGNFRLFHLFHSSLLLADGFGDALGPQPREQVLKKLKASLSFLDFFSFLP